MTALREQEPEINIYVGDEGLDTGKRSLAKRSTNGKPYKKQKVTTSPNDRPIPRTNAFTREESSERNGQEDVSYRHLFSFAKADEQSQPDKSTKPTFSFLRKDGENEKTENGEPTKSLGFLHNDQSRSDLNEIKERHTPGNAEHDMEIDRPLDAAVASEYSDRRYAGGRHVNGEGSSKLASQRGNRQPYEEFEPVRAQGADALVIPEVIESCPDALLRIATRFCRTKSIQELEEEWSAPGGTRETMKRDFKQKRQNVTRGRKLGSSNKR